MEIRAVACHEWELRNQFRFSIFPFSFSLFLPVGGIKRFRKQFTHRDDFGFAFQIRQNYRNVAAKLPNQLAARATRRCELIRVRNHGDGVKAALAFADGFENGDAFSTNGEAIRRVRKLEYGACAFSRACLAAEIKMSLSPTLLSPTAHQKNH